MTLLEYAAERRHIVQTRLAMLEAPDPPEAWQQNIAVAEADAHEAALRAQERADAAAQLRDFKNSL